MQASVILLALVLTFSVHAPVRADEASSTELPAIDGPDQWHQMTHDDATSSSKCIGDPKTPLCAIETVLACFVREERDLCLAGMGVRTVRFDFGNKRPEYSQRYWVAGVEMVTAKNKASYKAVRYLKPQIDDIAIRIHDVFCYFGKCGNPVGPPAIYLVRENGDKWMVAGWATPRW